MSDINQAPAQEQPVEVNEPQGDVTVNTGGQSAPEVPAKEESK